MKYYLCKSVNTYMYFKTKLSLSIILLLFVSCEKSNDNIKQCWICTIQKKDQSLTKEKVCDKTGLEINEYSFQRVLETGASKVNCEQE